MIAASEASYTRLTVAQPGDLSGFRTRTRPPRRRQAHAVPRHGGRADPAAPDAGVVRGDARRHARRRQRQRRRRRRVDALLRGARQWATASGARPSTTRRGTFGAAGQAAALRLYLRSGDGWSVPGFTNQTGYDALAALVQWTEDASAPPPSKIIAVNTAPPYFQRPLCHYPNVAKMREGGDPHNVKWLGLCEAGCVGFGFGVTEGREFLEMAPMGLECIDSRLTCLSGGLNVILTGQIIGYKMCIKMWVVRDNYSLY